MAKFKAGDPVVLPDGRRGVVADVPALDPRYLEAHEQFYSVRLEPWAAEPFRDENGRPAVRYRHPEDAPGGAARYRDHEADTLGCVGESQLGGR